MRATALTAECISNGGMYATSPPAELVSAVDHTLKPRNFHAYRRAGPALARSNGAEWSDSSACSSRRCRAHHTTRNKTRQHPKNARLLLVSEMQAQAEQPEAAAGNSPAGPTHALSSAAIRRRRCFYFWAAMDSPILLLLLLLATAAAAAAAAACLLACCCCCCCCRGCLLAAAAAAAASQRNGTAAAKVPVFWSSPSTSLLSKITKKQF